MPTAREWLRIAEESSSAANTLLNDCRFRSCLSRSYYSMYQAAHGMAVHLGATPRAGFDNWAHRDLAGVFDGSIKRVLKSAAKEIRQDLLRCYYARCIADYQADQEISQESAAEALRQARRFIYIAREVIGR